MSNQQLLLRNPNPGVTVLTPNPEHPETYLRFEGAGDKMGGDELYVSRATAELPATIAAVRKGTLIAEGLDGRDPLAKIMVSQKQGDQEPEPLTADRVVWDDEGKPTTEKIKVTIAPLYKD